MTTEFGKWSCMNMISSRGERPARLPVRTASESRHILRSMSIHNYYCRKLAPGLGFKYHIKYIFLLLPSLKAGVGNIRPYYTRPLSSCHTNYVWQTKSTWKLWLAIRKDNVPQINDVTIKIWDTWLDFQGYQFQRPHNSSCKCFTSDESTAPTSRVHNSA